MTIAAMKPLLKTNFCIVFSTLFACGMFFMTPDDALGHAVKVEVVESNGKYQLLRSGQPYHVKGAGLANGDLESFAAHGGIPFARGARLKKTMRH